MSEGIFAKYPLGSKVRYIGGSDVIDSVGVKVGDIHEITEHDDVFMVGEVAGFSASGGSASEGAEDFVPISFGGFLFPDTTGYFEIVS